MSLDAGTTLKCADKMYADSNRKSTTNGSCRAVITGDHMYEPPEGSLVWTAADPAPGYGPGRRPFVRPLPDPVAIRVRAIPDAMPPYDEQEPGDGGTDSLAVAIAAALDQDDPANLSPPGLAPSGCEPSGCEPSGAAEPASGNAPGRGVADGGRGQALAQAPGPVWPSRFAQVLAETLAGSRPPAQLTPWTTERARSHIRRLGPMLVGGQQPVVRRVVTSRPTSGVLEMSVVVGLGPRVHALAIRLERERSPHPVAPRRPAMAPGRPAGQARWLCTAVEAA
jgi:hypothetical protein